MPPTERIVVDPVTPDAAAISYAARVLTRGGLVAFPTETVYGLGASALDAESVHRIFAAKRRPVTNPVIVHVLGLADARRLAEPLTPSAEALAARFWPGPLTLVVPRASCIPDVVAAGGPTVALRAPAHPVARALLAGFHGPIAAPSANASSRLSPTTADHVLSSLEGAIDLVLDGGACSVGIESTVVDVSAGAVRVLRPGSITRASIEAVVGGAASIDAHAVAATGPIRSPGLAFAHYQPASATVELVPGAALPDAIRRLRTQGHKPYTLTYSCTLPPGDRLPADAPRYASQLYAKLHAIDALARAEGYDVIVVEQPPEGLAWEGIRDRLQRASFRP